MVKVTKPYVFTGPGGTSVPLASLFEGRQQLLIYHFMFSPESDAGCSSCSFFADHVPNLSHLASRNTSFAAVSRAPIEKIEAFKKRMGWTFPWYSSAGTEFNYDFNVTMDENVKPVMYNFREKKELEERGLGYATRGEQQGMSVFWREKEGGDVFHTYSTYGRGNEKFMGTYQMLDITPFGRQDGRKPDLGFEYHDQYDISS